MSSLLPPAGAFQKFRLGNSMITVVAVDSYRRLFAQGWKPCGKLPKKDRFPAFLTDSTEVIHRLSTTIRIVFYIGEMFNVSNINSTKTLIL